MQKVNQLIKSLTENLIRNYNYFFACFTSAMGKNKSEALGRSLIKARFGNRNKKLNSESFVSFYIISFFPFNNIL